MTAGQLILHLVAQGDMEKEVELQVGRASACVRGPIHTIVNGTKMVLETHVPIVPERIRDDGT